MKHLRQFFTPSMMPFFNQVSLLLYCCSECAAIIAILDRW